VHVLQWLLRLKTWDGRGPTQQLHLPLQPDWTTPPPLTRLHRYKIIFFKGLLVNVEARAVCMSSLTQLVCTHCTGN
jgi:hypothetical protein